MGSRTKIAWTDATWSCLRGCSRTIAAGAETSGCGDATGGGCYAERDGWRFAGPGLPYEGLVRMTPNGARWTGRVLVIDKHLLDPIRWQRPRKIFTTSVSDPFHERFSNETIAILVGVMAVTRRHIHQMLTKRARRMRGWFDWVVRQAAAANGGRGVTPAMYCFALLQHYVADRTRFSDHERALLSRGDIVEAAYSASWPLPNLWPMVSVEHQPAADDRIPDLLAVPAAVHGLSCEPLIDHVDLTGYLGAIAACGRCAGHESASGPAAGDCECCAVGAARVTLPGVSWVVVGAESGPRARPCNDVWLWSLRDQCRAAGVPYFVKQLVVSGKLRKDINEFPADLQIQEFPQ